MVATPSLIYSLPQAGPRVPRGHAGAAGNQRRLNTSQRTTSLTTTAFFTNHPLERTLFSL